MRTRQKLTWLENGQPKVFLLMPFEADEYKGHLDRQGLSWAFDRVTGYSTIDKSEITLVVEYIE